MGPKVLTRPRRTPDPWLPKPTLPSGSETDYKTHREDCRDPQNGSLGYGRDEFCESKEAHHRCNCQHKNDRATHGGSLTTFFTAGPSPQESPHACSDAGSII